MPQQQSRSRNGSNNNSKAFRPGRKQQPSKSGLSTSSSNIPEQQCCSTSAEQQQLCSDPAILLYAKQLDDHRKRCELSGRYDEAGAAASRIKGLRAAEAVRLKGLLSSAHQAELAQIQGDFQQESLDFDAAWRSRVSEYEASVATQLCNLKQQHEAQLTELLVRCESDRPSRPSTAQRYLMAGRLRRCWSSRATTHYMTHMLPAHLVMSQLLQGQYRRAHEVKLSTDALYESELAATHQAWELVVELKQNKLVSKQQGELDAFLARASRGRNELELSRRDETDKRANRFRALVQEVDGLHRLELLHLQAYLDSSQALVSPYTPLRATNLKRKRELLGLQSV